MKKEETFNSNHEIKLAHIRLLAAILKISEEEVTAAIQEMDFKPRNDGQ